MHYFNKCTLYLKDKIMQVQSFSIQKKSEQSSLDEMKDI